MRSFPSFGSGQKTFGHPAMPPILPRNSRGNFGSFWLSQRRWRRDRSPRQKIPWIVDLRNEGTPYRDFGPHTHRKAPVEARALFSEESRSNLRDWDYCSTAGLHGQARCNSQNPLSVAIDIPVVNCLCGKIVSQTQKYLPPARSHNSPQLAVLVYCKGLGLAFVRDRSACRNIRSASTLKNSDRNYFFGLI